jgi:hypothetical protein
MTMIEFGLWITSAVEGTTFTEEHQYIRLNNPDGTILTTDLDSVLFFDNEAQMIEYFVESDDQSFNKKKSYWCDDAPVKDQIEELKQILVQADKDGILFGLCYDAFKYHMDDMDAQQALECFCSDQEELSYTDLIHGLKKSLDRFQRKV